jgi:hypothetical protein
MVFVLDVDAEMPEPPATEGGVVGGLTGVVVAVRPYDETEVELAAFAGEPDPQAISGLTTAFDGAVFHASGRGLLVGAPTGDEIPLGVPSDDGPVRVRVWHDDYPATRVVVAVGEG